jgi:transposase
VASKENAVKKYIVTLSDEERKQLTTLIQSGKHPAQQLLKARILLKADASPGGEGWSDGQIATALETSADTVARTRQRLVEEGLEAALTRKHSPNSARRRIFDGAAEARLIALACSKPPAGRARWTLQLLEEAVVELKIVERASDNTPAALWAGGRSKKHAQAASETTMGHSPRRQRRLRRRHGGHPGGLSTAA